MDSSNDQDDDFLVDWLFRAFVGTSEIHEKNAGKTKRFFTVVNEHVIAPRSLELPTVELQLLPPKLWQRQGGLNSPLMGGVIGSWQRASKHDDTTTYIEHIELQNVRCFEKLEIGFQRGMNILIGVNGSGKTTILDALAAGLAPFVEMLQPMEHAQWSFLDKKDVRISGTPKGITPVFEPQYPAKVIERTQSGSWPITTTLKRTGTGRESIIGGFGNSSTTSGEVMQWAVQEGFDVTLPLVAYYGTERVWQGKAEATNQRDDLSRLAGYHDCLEPSANLTNMRSWFRRMELLGLQDGQIPPALEACKRAILGCLDGFDVVRYDARLNDLAARSTKTGLFLGFDQLSAGQRNMLGMVADIAYRAATLNPHFGAEATVQTPGMVLVDELDLHLHPAWQRRIVGALQRAFPRMQFIVTTHSPQVLGAVRHDSILVLEDGRVYHPPAPTFGRDSNSILAEILDVSERPVEAVARIEEVTRLLDDGHYVQARTALDALAKEWTERDPDVVRLRNVLSVVERIDASD